MDKRNIPTLSQLFWTFFKLGAFTFGGGYAMLPLIQKEIVETRAWIDMEQFCDVLACAQSGPGAVAINTAIFTGYKLLGIPGVAVATLGVVLPSFFIILIIAATLSAAGPSAILTKVFAGIRPAVVALIAAAAIGLGKSVLKTKFSYAIAVIALITSLLTNLHPALMILAAAVVGYVDYALKKRQVAN